MQFQWGWASNDGGMSPAEVPKLVTFPYPTLHRTNIATMSEVNPVLKFGRGRSLLGLNYFNQYSYLNSVAPPNKKTPERQDKTRPSLFVKIEKYLVNKKISQNIFKTQFLPSPIHRDNSADVFVQMAKYIS